MESLKNLTSPWQYTRLKTHTIKVGNLEIGCNQPVRVQSMANTTTHHIEASVKQAVEMIEAGTELVRFTVVNSNDAKALRDIKNQLVAKGYQTPVVADVHFNPELADMVAPWVDKVRINPGNYLEKRATFESMDYSEVEYQAELQKLEQRFSAFLAICKTHHTAIRVGTNHGSLSDRIMSRYGDTPQGMVEATMEFLRICRKYLFTNVAVSLKSSNTRVMVQAYRLLALQMQSEEMLFPLHLGVTEAGGGEDGIIKSAVGIGALMNDGLGDTIRVSLTGSPVSEMIPAQELVSHFEKLTNLPAVDYMGQPSFDPYQYQVRSTKLNKAFHKNPIPKVVADLSGEPEITIDLLNHLGFIIDETTSTLKGTPQTSDVIYVGTHMLPIDHADGVEILMDCNAWSDGISASPLFSFDDYVYASHKSSVSNWVQISWDNLSSGNIELLKNDPTLMLVLFSSHPNQTAEQRAFINVLMENSIDLPVIIFRTYNETDHQQFQIKAAADTGIFFIDGLANGLWLKNTFHSNLRQLTDTAFGILQASRARYTKTEYIACPSCGRTLFDIEKSLAEVKKATIHLTGLKIAVMGCIVNGPGEMADADYGYVGAGPGKVNLYRGKELVKRNIDEADALNELLNLIRPGRPKH
jgi:(E)-4-hydroxy-3-methylbut-2-enyl-diphosphate synthase